MKNMITGNKSSHAEEEQREDTEHRLTVDSSVTEASEWLQRNGFQHLQEMFMRYTGADMLRLSKVDVREICGVADGCRLYNALNRQSYGQRLYVKVGKERYFRTIFLQRLTQEHFVNKVASILAYPSDAIEKISLEHASGMHILITDEVIRNIRDEETFTVHVVKDTEEDTTPEGEEEGEKGGSEGEEFKFGDAAFKSQLRERHPSVQERDRTKILVKIKNEREKRR